MNKTRKIILSTVFIITTLLISSSIIHSQNSSKKNFNVDELNQLSDKRLYKEPFFEEEVQMGIEKDGKLIKNGKLKILRRRTDSAFSLKEQSKDKKFINDH